MKNQLVTKILSALLIMMLAVAAMPISPAYAATCTSNATGTNWNSATHWSGCGGNVPQVGDVVIIATPTTIDANTNNIASLTINAGQTLTIGNSNTNRTVTVAGNVTINAGATLNTAGNGGNQLTIGGNLANAGNFDMNIGGADANVTFNGGTNQTVSGTGATTDFDTITINNTTATNIVDIASTNFTVPGGFLTLTRGIFKVSGNFSLTNTFFGAAGYTINTDEGIWINNANVTVAGQNNDATLNGMLRVSAGTYNVGTGNGDGLDVNADGAALTIEGGTVNIARRFSDNNNTTNFTMTGGTLNLGMIGVNTNRSIFDLNDATSTFTMSGGTINIRAHNNGGGSSLLDFRNSSTTNTITGGTVQFGDAAITPLGTTFQIATGAILPSLAINTTNSPAVLLNGPTTVRGNLTIATGTTLNANNQTIAVSGNSSAVGNWTNNGTFTQGTGTVTFNGTSAQTISGSTATTFNNLTITNTNAAGVALSGIDATVNGILELNNKILSTDANVITANGAVNRTGATTANGFVNGKLRKPVTVGNPTVTYQVGTGTTYSPVSIVFNAVTTAGNITVSSTAGDHPQIGSSSLNSAKSVNRYWTLSNTGTVFTTYNPTFTFVPGDVDASAIPTSFIVSRYVNPSWFTPTIGTRTATTTQVTGLASTEFGDFAIGEIGKLDQTITFAAPASPATYNSTFSVASTSDSGLTVTVTPSGSCSISGNTVTMNSGTGTCTLTASQAGNASYNAATSVVQTVTAQKANQTITFTAPASAAYNSTFSVAPASDSNLTVTITPSGSCSISGNTVTMTSGTGTCTLTASQGGDGNYNSAAAVVQTVTAQKINQTITFAAPASPADYNSTFAVTPTSNSGLAVTVTPSGSCSISGNTVTMTSGTGTCTLTASQIGDGNYNPAADIVQTVTAQKINQTITFAAPVSPADYNSTFSVAPTSDSGLTVTVTPSGSCSISGSIVTITSGSGSCILTASQAGDGNYNAATSVVQTVVAQKANQTITFVAPASPATYNSTFVVVPTSDSSLTVAVTPSGSCSISGNTVTMNSGAGTCTLTASQVGDGNYNAATPIVRTVSAQLANQTITFVAPASPAAYNSTFAVAPTSDSNLTVTVTPSGVCTILAGTVTMTSGTGTCTLTASQAGDSNYSAATDVVRTVSAQKLNQSITVTTSAPPLAKSGVGFTVVATGGASGNSVDFSAVGSCTNSGANFTTTTSGNCTVHYNQLGDANYNASSEITETTVVDGDVPTVTIDQAAGQTDPTSVSPIVFDVVFSESVSDFDSTDVTITGMAGAPGITVSAGPGTNYTVSVTGMTSGETVTATIAAGVAHDTATNANTVSTTASGDNSILYDTTGPTATIDQSVGQANPTTLSPINFTVVFSELVSGFATGDVLLSGTAGATTAVVTEVAPNNGTTYSVVVSGMTSDGTVIVSIPGAVAIDVLNNNNLASTEKIIIFDTTAPRILTGGINTINDTGDGVLTEFEVVTIDLTKFSVTFSEDLVNVGNGDKQYVDSVINPANYMLVRDLGDTADFQTVSCRGGAVVPADTKIDISDVTYNNSTHLATFIVNGGLPLSNGNYRLYVCGTTSITDLAGIKLAGTGTTAGTDLARHFTISIPNNGSLGNEDANGTGKKTNKSSSTFKASNFLIPVTGFAPNQTTLLPAQPADKAYKPLDEIRIEIPTLGINFPIVGATVSTNGWDLTWLKDSVAYLEGSAYPTLSGNTVLTAHVTDANNNLGPFSDIRGMQVGQYIYIHAYGQTFVYQVQENIKTLPSNISAVFKHQEYSWVTLVTCEDYDAKTAAYKYRRMVRAVLISVVPEK